MIQVVANALIPVFAGLAVGYLAGLRRIVDNQNVRTLITFLMSFALPCALFTTIVRAPHPHLLAQARVMLVLAVVYLGAYGVTYWSARRLGGLSGGDGAVQSLTLSFPNVAAIGIPLLPAVYGSDAAISAAVAIAVGAVTISPITLAILESNTGAHDHLATVHRVRVSLMKAFQRPVVWAPLLGVVFVLANLGLPTAIDRSLSLFATATGGTALFLTGLILSAQRFALRWSVLLSVVGKTVLQPALGLGVARVVGLSLEQTRDVVLISAIPCGFFGVVFGKSFNATPEVASSSLIASTTISIVTLGVWIVVLSQLS